MDRTVGHTIILKRGGEVTLRVPDRLHPDIVLFPGKAGVGITLTALEAESLGRELIAYAKESRTF